MGCLHGHTSDGNCITVCFPSNLRYAARVRAHGHRRYQMVGRPSASKRKALRDLADAMATGKYKRGDVLASEREPSYYDPSVIYEMVRQGDCQGVDLQPACSPCSGPVERYQTKHVAFGSPFTAHAWLCKAHAADLSAWSPDAP